MSGGRTLTGVVKVDGSKNAALPLVAAWAVAAPLLSISNVPHSRDVRHMVSLLQSAGYTVRDEAGTMHIAVNGAPARQDQLAAAAQIRASYYLVAPLLATQGKASLPWPGGCRIGERGMDLHFDVYHAFGDHTTQSEEGYRVEMATQVETSPVLVRLPFRSRGATVAALLRAAIGNRTLELHNPSLSPEALVVAEAFAALGHLVEITPEIITLTPRSRAACKVVHLPVPGDKIEACTLLVGFALTRGAGVVEGINGAHLLPVIETLRATGAELNFDEQAIHINAARRKGADLRIQATLVPHGIDADWEPSLLTLGTQVPGQHFFEDAINPGRHANLLAQMSKLGLQAHETTAVACTLTGGQTFTGNSVTATDIRTGTSLILGALVAAGQTTIDNITQIERGHADIVSKLRHLGADIAVLEQ